MEQFLPHPGLEALSVPAWLPSLCGIDVQSLFYRQRSEPEGGDVPVRGLLPGLLPMKKRVELAVCLWSCVWRLGNGSGDPS